MPNLDSSDQSLKGGSSHSAHTHRNYILFAGPGPGPGKHVEAGVASFLTPHVAESVNLRTHEQKIEIDVTGNMKPMRK